MKRLSIQNILVPIDFSKMSAYAIKEAGQLARRFGATIHLAHVRPFDSAIEFVAAVPPIVPFPSGSYGEDGQERAIRELKAFARKYGVSSAVCHAVSGAPAFDEICRIAQKIPANLVVMPTHGRTGLKHVLLGSTAERVVQHCPCPVFVVRERERHAKISPRLGLKKILVPVDFSRCSRAGVQYAINFAEEFRATLILLHATYLGYIYASEGTAIYDVAGLQRAARKSAGQRMQHLVRNLNFGDVKFETAFTDGSPVIDICAFAKERGVDLIITSTHGLTGFKHVMMGSIAEQVVRHAPCSVLVVPSHPKIRLAQLAKSSPRKRQTAIIRQRPREFRRGKALTKRARKLAVRAFPERRHTNKFRESHLSR